MPDCPTPDKRGYISRRVAKEGRGRHDKWLDVYLCRCGKWHVTKRRNLRRYRLRPGAARLDKAAGDIQA